MATGVVIKKF